MSSVAAPRYSVSISSRARLEQTGVVIPTYNAASHWKELQKALTRQSISREQVFIIDSSSSDNTVALARRAGYAVETIRQNQFRHGATRQIACLRLPWAETLLYLTQDAVPTENAITNLLEAFDDPKVGVAYGRQLPRPQADAIERHARLFNYPPVSDVRDLSARERIGFKSVFCSNSFAAYRTAALREVGGFPMDAIALEDVTVAAKMLLGGWKVAYQADATVVHSHHFTVRQEFVRYFDTGVHHGRERWLLKEFGGTSGEGLKFIGSELRHLLKEKPSLIPIATARNAAKWIAYKLGMHEARLPFAMKRAMSSQRNFWQEPEEAASRRREIPADR